MKIYQQIIIVLCIIIYFVVLAYQTGQRHILEKERLDSINQLIHNIDGQHEYIIKTLDDIKSKIDQIPQKRGTNK